MSTISLKIPADDAAQFSMLPSEEKVRVRTLLKLFEAAAAAKKPRRMLMEWVATQNTLGLSLKRLETLFADVVRQGKHWSVLVNKAKAPRMVGAGWPQPLVEYWQKLCEENQRKCRPAHRELMRRIRHGENIPGVGTWLTMWIEEHPHIAPPANCPPEWIPRSLTYGNAMLYAPDKHALALARIGHKATFAYRPVVLTTRKGIEVGQFIMFDDMFDDHKVVIGKGRDTELFRCVELSALDLASGWWDYGMKPITTGEDGAKQIIRQREMLFFLAYWLTKHGYREAGTVFIGENATATIGNDVARYLHDHVSSAITVELSPFDAKPLMEGMFHGTGGNSRFKAAIESRHNLIHNELASLPGQQGLSPERKPAEAYGRDQYTNKLIRVLGELQGREGELLRQRLMFPHMWFHDYAELKHVVYERLKRTMRDHDLEGWEASGNYRQVFEATPGARGMSMEEIAASPRRAAIMELMAAMPETCVRQSMTRQEVWDRGQKGLKRMDWFHVPHIVGVHNGTARTTDRHTGQFVFEDAELGAGDHVYLPEIHRVDGGRELARRGETYLTFILPSDPRVMILCREDGGVHGFVRAQTIASRGDVNGVRRSMGEVNHIRSMQEAPVLARHTDQRDGQLAMRAHNDALIAEAQAAADAVPAYAANEPTIAEIRAARAG